MSSDPITPKVIKDEKGVWLSEAEAAELKSLLSEKLVLEEFSRKLFESYKTFGYLIATTCIEDLAKLKKAQGAMTVAVNVIRNTGTQDQKTQLAKELAALKEKESSADARKELLQKFGRGQEILEYEGTLDKMKGDPEKVKSLMQVLSNVELKKEVQQPPKSPTLARHAEEPGAVVPKSPVLAQRVEEPAPKSPVLPHPVVERTESVILDSATALEVDKFAQSYDPDAKFERAQPSVPKGLAEVKPTGILPKMGSRGADTTKKVQGGSACPVCAQRFPDQDSLVAHIEDCASQQPSVQAPAPPKANLFRKTPDVASQGLFISGPTNVSHDSHTSSSLVASTPTKKAMKAPPRKPAPVPPKRDAPQARPRSVSTPASQKGRPRSMSVGSAAVQEDIEEEEMVLEVQFLSGDVTLECLNQGLGNKTAADANVVVIVKVGNRKRQLEVLPVSTVLGFKRDFAFFSSYDVMADLLKIGVLLLFKNGAKEFIGSLEVPLNSLLEVEQEVLMPLQNKDNNVGRISFRAKTITRVNPRTQILKDRVSFKAPPVESIPLVKAMSAARYAMTVGLSMPFEGHTPISKQEEASMDPLLAAAEVWPPRVAQICSLIKSQHPLPPSQWANGLGQSLLHLVAAFGDMAALDILLRASVRNERDAFVSLYDRNKRDRRQFTPLHYAIINDNQDVVTALVQAGARIDGTYMAMQPVHMAALLGKDSMLKLILEKGGIADTQDLGTQATPMFYAAFSGSIACIDTLISKGAFVEAEDKSGLTPCMLAALNDNVAMVLYLMGRSTRTVMTSFDGSVSLPWVVLVAEHPELRALMSRFKKQAVFEKIPPFSRTLLHKAVLHLNDEALVEAIQNLLRLDEEDGELLDQCDNMGKTALHYASALGKEIAVKLLLEAGADVNIKDEAGNTALHFAFLPSIAELLMEKGALPNEQNNQGNSPLHMACALGLLELRSCLLGWGSSETLRNNSALTPRDMIHLVPPKGWKLQVKMKEKDIYDVPSGGVYLGDPIPQGAIKEGLQGNAKKVETNAKRMVGMVRDLVNEQLK